MADLEGVVLVVGVTGSIAAYKAPVLVRQLQRDGAEVRVVLTPAASRFVTAQTFAPLAKGGVFQEMFEEPPPAVPRHLQVPAGAHAVVVAPASADFIGRLAAGLADDLLAAVCMAAACPLLLAPAMHAQMWANRVVQANVERLRSLGVHFVGPTTGDLASGDTGVGRMVEPEVIREALLTLVGRR